MNNHEIVGYIPPTLKFVDAHVPLIPVPAAPWSGIFTRSVEGLQVKTLEISSFILEIYHTAAFSLFPVKRVLSFQWLYKNTVVTKSQTKLRAS